MIAKVILVFKVMKCLYIAVQNHFHFYWHDFCYFLSLALQTVVNFYSGSWKFSKACYGHYYFLHTHQLTTYPGLMDFTGQFKVYDMNGDNGNSRMLGFEKNETHNTAHFPLSSSAIEQMWGQLDGLITDYGKAVFIDFGCGVGWPLLTAIQRPFLMTVGVEIDESTGLLAKSNIEKFHMERKHLIKSQSITIQVMDMGNYQLPSIVKDRSCKTILFMYEPLWTVEKNEAHRIYARILRRFASNCSTLYIVYFLSSLYCGGALRAIQEIPGINLVYDAPYLSLFFGANFHVYIYAVNSVRDD